VGAPGNAVLGGHRDTHFAFLRDLVPGTEILVEDAEGHWHVYRVTGSFVAHEREVGVVADTPWPQLTLVTCWPFDALRPGGPLRYVVVAEDLAEGWDGRARPEERVALVTEPARPGGFPFHGGALP